MTYARAFLTVAALSLNLAARCQQAEVTPDFAAFTHGTINVVLANRAGAVVETDSQLSSNGFPVGLGQKLFQIDDHTVCAIAGFYTAPEPEFAGNYTPTPSSVPAMIQQYLEERKGQFGNTMTEKMDNVVQIFAFDLNFVVNVMYTKAQHVPTDKEVRGFVSQVTLVGYEGDRLKILQAQLTPIRNGEYLSFQTGPYKVTTVGKKLEHATAGLDREVKATLEDTRAGDASSAILDNYYSSIRSTDGESLNLHDLELLANALVRKATSLYPGEVGGDRQKAIFESGHLTVFDEPITPTPPKNLQMAGIFEHFQSIHNREAIHISGPLDKEFIPPRLFIGAHIEGSDQLRTFQRLDDLVFTQSTFEKCYLDYEGSPLTIFDSSNTVNDCVLNVMPNVDPNLPFLKRLKKEFPQLFIKRDPSELHLHPPQRSSSETVH